ncbi:UNVERIFIED_CONTAM: Zinc finger CCCH domain-containing protein 56 [Sesamum radiatum]|uniref:Zinc finger CCCH domain-containing protein 56 n=1 Tax=Sesamum radiatum TaxID=300843 RepID=A0AAW2TML5_SESRA
MVVQQMTPLMVAATYGSIDVLKLIVSLPEVDVNRNCGIDKSTALHCAASGGSVNAIDVVQLLLAAGADPNLVDANGRRPLDVLFVSPKLQGMKYSLQVLLATDTSFEEEHNLRISIAPSNSNSPPLSPSHLNELPCSPELVLLRRVESPMMFQHHLYQKRKNTLLIHLYQTSRTASTLQMNLGCFRLRSDPALVPTHMIGLSAPLYTRVKMLEEGIQGSTTIAVYRVQIFVRGHAEEGTCVNMLMGF